jgi:SH3-like domain-containing protein
VVWHGLRFQYDSNRYHFAETAAYTTDPRPQATASLSYTTDCPPNIADCAIAAAFLALYSRDGRDFWTWLAQQTIVSSADPVAGFSDDVVAGQPAAFWRSTGLEGSTIVVSVGEDVLIIVGVESDAVTQMIQMEPPNAIPLTAGQIATTTPDRTWELWSDATGGARVVERPQLYGGAFVSILAVEPQAVQVRTPEGVTGWIHAAAPAALSTRLAIGGEYARMLHTFQAQIAQGHAVPVRESPRSTANQRGDLLTPGQQVTVVSVRGDWLQVYSDAGPGWVRWYYDGTQYVDIVDQPQ